MREMPAKPWQQGENLSAFDEGVQVFNQGEHMATFKYFSDVTDEAVELKGIHQMDNAQFSARWPGVKGIRADGYSKWVAHTSTGVDAILPVTRMIEMKRFPTRHECNAKCLNGKHNGACECQCGGKNHGRGMFTRMLEAA